MSVRLHIERLVVDGFDLTGADAAQLEGAIAEALSARFATGEEAAWSSFAMQVLPPLKLAALPREGARGLGRQVAAALYGGLKP